MSRILRPLRPSSSVSTRRIRPGRRIDQCVRTPARTPLPSVIEQLETRVLLATDAWESAVAGLHGADLVGKDGPLAHVGIDLALLHYEHSTHVVDGSLKDFQPSNPLLHIVDEHVVVDVTANGDVSELAADLEALGMRVTGT